MSRIIKSILNTVLPPYDITYILCLENSILEKALINIEAKLISLEKYTPDTNDKIMVLSQDVLSNNLHFCPTAVICNTFAKYPMAANVSQGFRIPLVNIIRSDQGIKKESIFSLSKQSLVNNINFVSSHELAEQLLLYNYVILSDNTLEQDILTEIKKWKLI